MEHVQVSEDGKEALQITTHGNVEWDANNLCTAAALIRDGKAAQFRVFELTITEPPEIDHLTQRVIRDGCECVNGKWQYRWRIDPISNINTPSSENKP